MKKLNLTIWGNKGTGTFKVIPPQREKKTFKPLPWRLVKGKDGKYKLEYPKGFKK